MIPETGGFSDVGVLGFHVKLWGCIFLDLMLVIFFGGYFNGDQLGFCEGWHWHPKMVSEGEANVQSNCLTSDPPKFRCFSVKVRSWESEFFFLSRSIFASKF